MQLGTFSQLVVVNGPASDDAEELLIFLNAHNQLLRRFAELLFEVLEEDSSGAAAGNVQTLGLALEEPIFVN